MNIIANLMRKKNMIFCLIMWKKYLGELSKKTWYFVLLCEKKIFGWVIKEFGWVDKFLFGWVGFWVSCPDTELSVDVDYALVKVFASLIQCANIV